MEEGHLAVQSEWRGRANIGAVKGKPSHKKEQTTLCLHT